MPLASIFRIAALVFLLPSGVQASTAQPWMNPSLSPDRRAELVLAAMTLDEKIQLVHGEGWGVLQGGPPQAGSNGGSGFARGIPRLGIPNLEMDDAALGVRLSEIHGRYSTALPCTVGAAASWNPEAAFRYGQVIGRELRAQGYNTALGGGVNLTREPRNGRNFEYAGEDPALAGTMVGHLIRGIQSQQVLGTLKHYAFNNQETGRMIANIVMDRRAMRESELLAFEVALKISDPAVVMAAYPKVNGDYACENDYLLNQVLKRDLGFKGFVMSDWLATHSTVKAALAGLDQEQPHSEYFGAPLKAAVQAGQVPPARLDDMVRRILRSMFACGVIDHPPVRHVPDAIRGYEDALAIAEQSLVLLKNTGPLLPFSTDLASVAVIGGHADVGVLGGGGSSRVDAPGGDVIPAPANLEAWMRPAYYPPSPLSRLQRLLPQTRIEFVDGSDRTAAAKAAARAQVAIVFVLRPQTEALDVNDLGLPDRQDELVAAVAAANPRTVVIVESGGPILMPWLEQVPAVLLAWYPGVAGGEAIARTLVGANNPAGRLSMTFPRSERDLPQPQVVGHDVPEGRAFDLVYREGARVGYKWFQSENKPVLFPFGFGLSYTTFDLSDLRVDDAARTATLVVTNSGTRHGATVAQVYVQLPPAAGEKHRRLVAWQRVELAPGEARTVPLALDPVFLSVFDVAANRWSLPAGDYTFSAGSSSADTPLTASVRLKSSR